MESQPTHILVDQMILDYLLWYCVEALLTEHRLQASDAPREALQTASSTGDSALRLVFSFYRHFLRAHPQSIEQLPQEIKFRLQLCRFASTFLRRLDPTSLLPSPGDSKATSLCSSRAATWLCRRQQSSLVPPAAALAFSSPNTPFPQAIVAANRKAEKERVCPTERLYGDLTLRDAVWQFMVLSAFVSATFTEFNRQWVELAVRCMKQAAIEGYQILGCSGPEIIDESFAYGIAPVVEDDSETVEEMVVNDMFAGIGDDDDEPSVARLMETTRDTAITELIPPDGCSTEAHFQKLVEDNNVAEFEEFVIDHYMAGIWKKLPRPVLVQLEGGKLAGYEDKDIENLLASVGMLQDVLR